MSEIFSCTSTGEAVNIICQIGFNLFEHFFLPCKSKPKKLTMRISKVVLLCLIFTFSASSQIKTANFESGLFQIVGPELSSGDYSSLSLGFDVKKAQAAMGFNYVRASYSETDYEILELHSSADLPLYQNNRLVLQRWCFNSL